MPLILSFTSVFFFPVSYFPHSTQCISFSLPYFLHSVQFNSIPEPYFLLSALGISISVPYSSQIFFLRLVSSFNQVHFDLFGLIFLQYCYLCGLFFSFTHVYLTLNLISSFCSVYFCHGGIFSSGCVETLLLSS